MESIQKTAKGFSAQIYIFGHRDSKTFRTQREAKAWAESRTFAIRTDHRKAPSELHTLADAIYKYLEEVSPGKRGERWERVRLTRPIQNGYFRASPSATISAKRGGEKLRSKSER